MKELQYLGRNERKSLNKRHYNLAVWLKSNGINCKTVGSSIWVYQDKFIQFTWHKDKMIGRFLPDGDKFKKLNIVYGISFEFFVKDRNEVLAKILKHTS